MAEFRNHQQKKYVPAAGSSGDVESALKAAGPVAAAAAAAPEPWYQSFIKSCLYGLINTVVVTPVMVGFAAIIFRHKAFHEDPAVYSQLVKLCLFSSAVHQAAFTSTSSLPFAIGQIQDAGLIFLSKIASDIATEMASDPPSHMLATVLVTLSLCTSLLGVALIITGKWKLAGLVQYLPLPVVGGYLAFIGLYCLEAVSVVRPHTRLSAARSVAHPAHCPERRTPRAPPPGRLVPADAPTAPDRSRPRPTCPA